MLRAICAVLLSLQVGMLPPARVVRLYPEGQAAGGGIVENGLEISRGPGEITRPDTTEFYWQRDGSLNAVSDSARVVLYLPQGCNGQLILVCPGGGYNELMFRSEGTYAAQCLTERGYAVGIVCYRMPVGHASAPLTDVQNAFRYCRHHAGEWGITQIGVMGMSAGGHLAACASTLYTDEVTRPDFTILFYPVVSCDTGLIHRGSFRKLTGLPADLITAAAALGGEVGSGFGAGPDADFAAAVPTGYTVEDVRAARMVLEHYSPVHNITADTPPALLFHSADDRGVPYANSVSYFDRLRTAGVPAELHIFPSGGHGWGFNTLETAGRDKLEPYRATFFSALDAFLSSLRP
ncbi:MAG: alpha/beta hydrolase [Bacteroidales bacterium]|nr:alpha/beta hydrolase [Bacteroidales bacterium]